MPLPWGWASITKFIPDYNNIIPTKPYTEDILGLPVINIRHVPLTNNFLAVLKRLMDIAGSLFGIVTDEIVFILTHLQIIVRFIMPLKVEIEQCIF